MSNRRQCVTWTNDDLVYWHIIQPTLHLTFSVAFVYSLQYITGFKWKPWLKPFEQHFIGIWHRYEHNTLIEVLLANKDFQNVFISYQWILVFRAFIWRSEQCWYTEKLLSHTKLLWHISLKYFGLYLIRHVFVIEVALRWIECFWCITLMQAFRCLLFVGFPLSTQRHAWAGS